MNLQLIQFDDNCGKLDDQTCSDSEEVENVKRLRHADRYFLFRKAQESK